MSVKGEILRDNNGNLSGARFAFAGMNFMVDPADIDLASGQCVDICNGDVDYAANVSRRSGSVLHLGGNITSAWANSDAIYCVENGKLCRVIDDAITPFANSPTMLDLVEFKQVNNVVVYSDGVTIGLIDAGELFVFSDTVRFA